MNVLVISSVMPAPLSNKTRENDVLFVTADRHENFNVNTKYFFLYIVPYSNLMLALFSDKWKEYFHLKRKKYFIYRSRKVEVIAIPGFTGDSIFKKLFINFSFQIYKRRLKRIIEEKSIDLIHAHNVGTDAAFANKLSQKFEIPYVVTTRNIHNRKLTPFIKNNLKDARALISLNPTLKRLADGFHSNSLLIPHGLDSSFFKVKKQPSNKPYLKIVSACRLLDWKNIDKVLLALDQADGLDFRYDIYGDGPDKERLMDILTGLSISEKVTFRGFADYSKIPEILSNYDVFVLISYPETFGRIFIESLAVGLPIIAAIGCGMDGIIKNGEEGFLVSHQDSAELSRVFKSLYQNREKLQQSAKAARDCAEKFEWSRIVEKIDSLYKSI